MSNYAADEMVRTGEVAKRMGIHRSSVLRKAAEGMLTPPVRLHKRCSVWPSREVEMIRAAYIAGADKDEIKELVKRLREARARHYEALKRLTKTDEQPEKETD